MGPSAFFSRPSHARLAGSPRSAEIIPLRGLLSTEQLRALYCTGVTSVTRGNIWACLPGDGGRDGSCSREGRGRRHFIFFRLLMTSSDTPPSSSVEFDSSPYSSPTFKRVSSGRILRCSPPSNSIACGKTPALLTFPFYRKLSVSFEAQPRTATQPRTHSKIEAAAAVPSAARAVAPRKDLWLLMPRKEGEGGREREVRSAYSTLLPAFFFHSSFLR